MVVDTNNSILKESRRNVYDGTARMHSPRRFISSWCRLLSHVSIENPDGMRNGGSEKNTLSETRLNYQRENMAHTGNITD